MQVFQCLDETLGELLLVGDRLRVEELGGRRGRDHPVGLDDEPFQLRGDQFEEPQVRGIQDTLRFAQMWLEVCVIRQAQVNILLHHVLLGESQWKIPICLCAAHLESSGDHYLKKKPKLDSLLSVLGSSLLKCQPSAFGLFMF